MMMYELICQVMTNQNKFIYTMFKNYGYYIALIFLLNSVLFFFQHSFCPLLHISTALTYGDKKYLVSN